MKHFAYDVSFIKRKPEHILYPTTSLYEGVMSSCCTLLPYLTLILHTTLYSLFLDTHHFSETQIMSSLFSRCVLFPSFCLTVLRALSSLSLFSSFASTSRCPTLLHLTHTLMETITQLDMPGHLSKQAQNKARSLASFQAVPRARN